MSVTGTEIHNSLRIDSGQVTTADTLTALQEACDAAWPIIRITSYNTGVATLAADVYEYSLAAVTDIENDGLSRVYVNPPQTLDEAEILLRGWRQRNDNGGWTLIFDPDVIENHAGKAINIEYQRRPAKPGALSATLEISREYAVAYTMLWYAMKYMTRTSTADRNFRDLTVLYREQADRALRKNWVQPMAPPRRIRRDRQR